MNLAVAAMNYRVIRDRIHALDPGLDEQTLADTVEGLTDVHEILMALIRAALADEALASGLKTRIAEMEDRLARLRDRASKRRQIAKEVMTELDIKKLQAPDFTASLRPGFPSLVVMNENEIPSIYWEQRDPKLDKATLISDLKQGREVSGAALSNPEPVLSVRTL
jgi:Siphovirus Gp157